jgi:hypothetical protein
MTASSPLVVILNIAVHGSPLKMHDQLFVATVNELTGCINLKNIIINKSDQLQTNHLKGIFFALLSADSRKSDILFKNLS